MVPTKVVSVWREGRTWHRLVLAAPAVVYEEVLDADGITWTWVSDSPPEGVLNCFDHAYEGN